jgi:hypothetical protein
MRLEAMVALVVASAAVALSGCSRGSSDPSAMIVRITAEGAAVALWENSPSGPITPPVCQAGVFLNGAITFTFDGPVSPSSVPQNGVATGSINIVGMASSIPAQGSFAVEDDPAGAAGNRRRVVFRPALPSTSSFPCGSGFLAQQQYEILVPEGGVSPQVVVVSGTALRNSAIACFSTCGCPVPGICVSSFTDPAPGPAYVVATDPPTDDPPPPPIDAGSVAANTIRIRFSEALAPAGIDLNGVRVIDAATGAQEPGSLVFHQAGTVPGMPTVSEIEYVAAFPLRGGTIYQIVLGATVQDLGGNPVQTSPTNPGMMLFFQTTPSIFCAQPPIVESFDTTQHLDLDSPVLRWAGTGALQAEFPTFLTGTGTDGAFNPPAAMTTILDTNELVGGQSRQGVWNFTSVDIPATATVRVIGPYLAHLRCTGTFTLNGVLNANAGAQPPNPGVPPHERGPETGIQNNGAGVDCEALGGAANAGGGIGGTGSGVTPPPGSPSSFQCAIRALHGENGYGATIAGALNPGVPANVFHGGGQGGDSGCFPPLGPGCTPGDLGGLGGAGGSAGRLGEAGVPRQPNPACAPSAGVVQPIAQPSGVPVAMVPPIGIASAGSGGGGGGDHLEPTGPPPLNDDQGGGGGGGGGGIHISCVGPYAQSTASAGGTISCSGAQGATAQTASGAGGSGSGGEIWIQSFATVTIAATAVMNVDGPPRFGPTLGNIGCSNQASGGGGAGLIQIEAGMGPAATPSFVIVPVPTPTTGAVFSAPPFALAGMVSGQARSTFFHAGYGAPDYTAATELLNLGNAPGATVAIRYEGAHAAVNSTPQAPAHDPSTIKSAATGGGPITAANLDELDGYAFIRFVVDVSYPPPPTTPANAILPSVDMITIQFSSPVDCILVR